MVNLDDFDKKNTYFYWSIWFCCISVECCEVTVASSGPGDQSGAVLDRVPSKLSKLLQFYLLKKLEKKVQKYLVNCC